jgi:acetyltransferase-like isoleucine patch superfamily enzyme
MSKWRLILIALLDIFCPHGKPGDRWRGALMAPLLMKCGKNFCMKRGVFFVSPHRVSIGENVYIGNYVNIGAGEIVLEDEVVLAPMVSINAQNHTMRNGSYRFGTPVESKVVLRRGCWIGVHACILSGADIGEGALVGAGCVVRRRVPPQTLLANAANTKTLKVVLAEENPAGEGDPR